MNRNSSNRRVIISGGAGFIGSALVRYFIKQTDFTVINIDNLSYAGNLVSLDDICHHERYSFEKVNICNQEELKRIFSFYNPDSVIHLAAETHVDRSIDGPENFIQTNIVGTYNLLEVSRLYLQNHDNAQRLNFRFHHVSTDEVFGTLGQDGAFHEQSPYRPNSPYSASKAAADHLVRAWHKTYQLPILITNCSNNYGPYQFPEKLIPLTIIKGLSEEQISVYGNGENIRDWLYIDDHIRALELVFNNGKIGESYNIGGQCQLNNIDVVRLICLILDELRPIGAPHRRLIRFVADRPGHDFRYAIDTSKISQSLGWQPQEHFESGLRKTVTWYINNQAWCQSLMNNLYQGQRLGLGKLI